MINEKNNEVDMDDSNIVTIYLEDRGNVQCFPIKNFFVEKREYVALLEIDEKNKEFLEMTFFFRYVEEEDEIVLEDIESDEEYEKVLLTFKKQLEEDVENELDNELEEEL